MQSSTHSLIALALLSKRGASKRNWAVFIGSVIPDIFIYSAWIWLTFIRGESQTRIWNEIYFEAPMQALASLFNSVPLYAALAMFGYFCFKRKWGHYLYIFALAALIHIAFDFPVHAHDAYAYFEPFTSWRFHSPLSYYEIDHHGKWVSTAEAFLALFCAHLLWKRFSAKWVRVILGLLTVIYVLQLGFTHLAPAFASA